MPMVSGEAHGAGAARDMVVASARTTATEIRRAMVSKEGPGGGPRREAIPGYRVESWVVGVRACLPSARKARSKVGESSPDAQSPDAHPPRVRARR